MTVCLLGTPTLGFDRVTEGIDERGTLPNLVLLERGRGDLQGAEPVTHLRREHLLNNSIFARSELVAWSL